MNIYHIWCNLKPGIKDTEFSDEAEKYFDYLQTQGQLHAYRITRRKLGLGPSHLPEFHIMLEFDSMTQMDQAFEKVSSRADPVEGFHFAVNSKVSDVFFALYRDFPDPGRVRGQELFD